MTTSNRLGITELDSGQNNRSVTVNEAIAKLEAGACMFGAVSVGDNSPAGGESEGDIYVVGTAGTGAFSGHNEAVAIYYNAAWLFFSPLAGMMAYAADEDAFYYFDGTDWVSAGFGGGVSSPYDFGMTFGDTPTADQVLGRVRIGRAITIPANMSGSSGGVSVNATSTFDIDVLDDGVSIGTISVATGGTVTFTTTGGTAKSVAAGSEIRFDAPTTPDATVEGGSFVILATVD